MPAGFAQLSTRTFAHCARRDVRRSRPSCGASDIPPSVHFPEEDRMARNALFDEQRKHRLDWMHWLHDKPKHARWARDWQESHQRELSRLETVSFGKDCFVASSVHIFAEPTRDISIGDGCHIGAEVFMHGPILLGDGVAINARSHLDGGSAGIVIGAQTRVAPGVQLFAFNHGIDAAAFVKDQPVVSDGIVIGEDAWIGANVCVTDGVRIGDHAVVGMGAVVTKDVPDWAVAAGNPARVIGDRRTWKPGRRDVDDAISAG